MVDSNNKLSSGIVSGIDRVFAAWLESIQKVLNTKMDEVDGGLEDNLPTFNDVGRLKDSGESIDTVRARAYFYGRNY